MLRIITLTVTIILLQACSTPPDTVIETIPDGNTEPYDAGIPVPSADRSSVYLLGPVTSDGAIECRSLLVGAWITAEFERPRYEVISVAAPEGGTFATGELFRPMDLGPWGRYRFIYCEDPEPGKAAAQWDFTPVPTK